MAVRFLRFLLAGLGALTLGVPLQRILAQDSSRMFTAPGTSVCEGSVISGIDVYAHPPSYNGRAGAAYEKMEGVVGIRHMVTRESVVRPYLRVKIGNACSERDRSESERLLRAQPFLSSASVRAIPDGPGRVRMQVDVVDEIGLTLAGSVSRGNIGSLAAGTQNVAGLGLGVTASAERGFAYRNGFGLRLIKYGAFGAPNYVAVAAERDPLGEAFLFEVAEPFLTDLQRRAFHVGASERSSYYGVMRPTGDDYSLYTRRVAYDAGWVRRIGQPVRGHTVGLIGAALLGEDVRVGNRAKIVSDTGLVDAPVDSTLDGRYRAFAVARVAAIAGLRALRFVTVRRFDAVRAQQDIGVGIQLGLLAGPSIWASRNASDFFVATDLYAGLGDDRSFFNLRFAGEARGNHQTHSWDGLVSSARLAWYAAPSDGRTQVLSVDASSIQHLAFPLQLTFSDAEAGLRGYSGASLAGGQRVIGRLEERWLVRLFPQRADFAMGVFADAGKLWAGDVPYGRTSGVHGSLGVSLLGAYPAGGKRTFRVDLAVPLNPLPGDSRFEIRFSATDHTRLTSFEPRDVARARTGSVPTTQLKW